MEMFAKDSDYEWKPVTGAATGYERYTVMQTHSAKARLQRNRMSLKKAVVDALNDISPDVLVVNGWGHRESRRSLEWARRNGCPVVLLSDSVHENVRRHWFLEAYKRWVVRGCRAAFVAGTPQARYVARLGVPKERIFHPGSCVVNNDYWASQRGLIARDVDRYRTQENLPARYFFAIARFIEFKNLPGLIRAYALYHTEAGSDPFGLVLCGSGPLERELRSLVGELGLEGVVRFPGFVQIDRLPIFYSLASCFVFPSSHFEPWGLVANEAMASSLPVLISQQCGCSEDLVKPGENGFTFDPADVENLAQLMLNVAALNPDQLIDMGKVSEAIVADHSCQIAADNLWRAVDAARGC
jgi:glycosyltransferase involved in cell wall biosynthesis